MKSFSEKKKNLEDLSPVDLHWQEMLKEAL